MKVVVDKIIQRIADGKLGTVYASKECLHELYYVSREEGVSLDEYIRRAAAITAIENQLPRNNVRNRLVGSSADEAVRFEIDLRRLLRRDGLESSRRPHENLNGQHIRYNTFTHKS